ncbi:cell division transport system ATP-binding protein [Enterococcus sp. DIV0840]|uniref:cell division ATP-binding protein FtsE n=1 Tax=Enterococcus TaxID=1350 RepID=UPI001A8C9402|nr:MULTISPECIES: ATP-binding cassette domain-containing protein [Enterococcus]MBO0435565.1 ATP-binding cassette domain-containing protein [Enterococcus sp. DIV0849a]MBO0472141.1 ATP-binding cassette domain-containing protein [Enterococcus ureasiticus]
MVIIELVDVYRSITNKIILKKINLSIVNGEFVFIIGKSGSGKSTLLKTLSLGGGVNEGKIIFNKKLMDQNNKSEMNYYRRNIGFIFQDFRLIQDLNVFENVAYPLEVQGIYNGEEVRKKVLEALETVDLIGFENRFPNQLSGGEKQRVAIARTLVGDFQILIADEPTANLDPSSADNIMDYLKKINREGQTIIMATHNLRIVNQQNNRIIELNNGEIIRDEKNGQYYKE